MGDLKPDEVMSFPEYVNRVATSKNEIHLVIFLRHRWAIGFSIVGKKRRRLFVIRDGNSMFQQFTGILTINKGLRVIPPVQSVVDNKWDGQTECLLIGLSCRRLIFHGVLGLHEVRKIHANSQTTSTYVELK